jgi:uncharacterized protein YabN with tetrapyrrole methylase and pyrophosphatase domain
MNNSKVTKTVDLSDYTDEQIKVMFQSAEMFETLKGIVKYLKTENYNPFDREPSKEVILKYIKESCVKNKVDPNLLGI